MDYENLYKSLCYNLSEDDLTNDEKDELVTLINSFDAEKHKVLYYLMLHDWLRYNPNTKVIFPYKTRQVAEKLEIKLDCIPIRVKQILYKFAKVAVKE